MSEKKPQQPPAQQPKQPSQGPRQLNEETAVLTGVRGGYTVTNTRPAPPNPDGGGGKDGKK
jgi:hypothetical protein